MTATQTTPDGRTWWRRGGFRVAVLAAAVLTVTSCSGTSATRRACDRTDDVRSAVENLRDVNLAENGLAVMQAQLDQVSVEVALLRADIGNATRPQADAVMASVDALRGSVATAKADVNATSVQAVADNLRDLRVKVGDLGTAVAETC
jgi:hypothetical protein